MSPTILVTILTLSMLALLSAIILYFVAQKFMVYEDPRIDMIMEALPAANCGACGYAGCRNFAEALVNSETLDGLNCPVGGKEVMKVSAKTLEREAPDVNPLVAVQLCNGSPEYRPHTSIYDGAMNCRISHDLYIGQSDCSYGCLGYGDCVRACTFDALNVDPISGLQIVSDSKCVGCGACVSACPRNLIELRKKAKRDRKIYVACSSCDKGAVARRVCKVACIGCGKCVKICEFEAITIENNLAYIDADKCSFCRKCVTECPTNSIIEVNFPQRKPKILIEAEACIE